MSDAAPQALSAGAAATHNSASALDVDALRAEFPALHQDVHGRPLVYLDNAATTHKPRCVIDAVSHYYCHDNSNVHRGVHALSERATSAYESVRLRIGEFFNAGDQRAVVFTRGATEAINLVAASHVEPMLAEGDEILITHMEHHSNIVPWQILAERTGAVLRVGPIHDDGSLDLEATLDLIGPRTRFVSVVHVSNSLGTVNPVRQIVEAAHARGISVLVDGAQATPHMAVDLQALDCDFYAFSGHKVYGPTGIGALIGRRALLERMRPYQAGGDMIRRVSFSGTEYNDVPYRFEAGTPNIAGTIGLGAALDFIQGIGLDAIHAHESALLARATELAAELPDLRLVGTAPGKAAVLSFVLDGVHPHDIGTILDTEGVAVRAGHHCTMPVMEHFGLPATTRASFGLYNTLDEVDGLFSALHRVRELFR